MLCCALLWLYIDWFSHIDQAYFTGTVAIPSASKATLMNMDKCFMWIHYERLHNHNKAKLNKPVCIFLGIYCSSCLRELVLSPLLFPSPWASCQISKIAGAHARGMPGTFSPSPQVSDPDMYHGTCVTHVPWCMPGSLTSGFLWKRRRRKTFPVFPAHAQPAILRIW